ncbi:MAG TPA: hypothetical protein ENH45_06185, partial [Nitrospirae bacterium]|nr:hypothetical protein [Nitrospirota bacterium]HDZ84793.1 hypothetical protein [Nitrospirota bacterium]HEW80768.1 hypothetical protein [Nitrospirota bacterium]
TSEEKRTELTNCILRFFAQRLEGILILEGHSYDVVNAVLSTLVLNLKDIEQRISIISELKNNPTFPAMVVAAKRVYNILQEDQDSEVNESLFTEEAEKELFIAAKNVNNDLVAGDFNLLFKLEKPIDIFFEKVLVMDKDDGIKNNRLALLSYVRRIFNSLGNFSKIIE